MLDTVTLRVVFAVLATSMLLLFYLGTYRVTRAAYCGWWCLSLALFVLASGCYLLNGTDLQVVGQPVGNAVGVTGAASVWAATSSLHARVLPRWQLATPGVVAAVTSAVDHPASNIWSGGAVFLALMSLLIGLAAYEMWRPRRHGAEVSTVETLASALGISATLVSIFYACRCVVFLAVGPSSRLFVDIFGSGITTLVTSVLLVVVSVGMSSLSNEQRLQVVRERAAVDDLTGLLTRAAFRRRATAAVQRARRSGRSATLVLADLDLFKDINDSFGHAVGDRVLRDFGEACRLSLRPWDLAGRVGGEEFCLLLPSTSPEQAERITARLAARLTALADGRTPTVSFGIAATDPQVDLDTTMEYADAALYRAKAQGRNRTVRHE